MLRDIEYLQIEEVMLPSKRPHRSSSASSALDTADTVAASLAKENKEMRKHINALKVSPLPLQSS
jgi:hypothetical protein